MESVLKIKSYAFAVMIIGSYKKLSTEKKEFILSKQLLRSGTAIGALIREANQAESKADFLHKVNIALKEANETAYWLSLLNDTDYISAKEYEILKNHCEEILKMLISTVKTTKKNIGR